jgi:hypothetical protein
LGDLNNDARNCSQNALNNSANYGARNPEWLAARLPVRDTCYHSFCQPRGHAPGAFYADTQGWICQPSRWKPSGKHNNWESAMERATGAFRGLKGIIMQEIHSFSDFAENHNALAGKKMRMEEILNKQIIILGYKIIASKKNEGEKCLHLQFNNNGEIRTLFTGSAVLLDQCEKYSEKLPFRAEIKKIDKYFTFA